MAWNVLHTVFLLPYPWHSDTDFALVPDLFSDDEGVQVARSVERVGIGSLRLFIMQ
jgi:hypothetical protein